jgi:hypothetical protein
MSEEEAQVEEPKEATPEPEPEAEAAPEEETTSHVDMDDGTQKRFNRIYGNMKQYERVVQQMGKDNRALLNRLDTLEGSQYTAEVTNAVDGLKADKVAALDEGDHSKVADIDDKIAQIRALPDPQPTPQAPTDDYSMSQQDTSIIAAWGGEQNTDGTYKRPWAQAGHPYNTKAAAIGAAVLEDPAIVAEGTQAVLAEVDKLMGLDARQRGQRTSPVLSSDGNVTRPKAKGTLTADQKLIADAMEVPHEKYLASLQE